MRYAKLSEMSNCLDNTKTKYLYLLYCINVLHIVFIVGESYTVGGGGGGRE